MVFGICLELGYPKSELGLKYSRILFEIWILKIWVQVLKIWVRICALHNLSSKSNYSIFKFEIGLRTGTILVVDIPS